MGVPFELSRLSLIAMKFGALGGDMRPSMP